MITRPGIYPNMLAADYFADPCPAPSLTQSIAKILCSRSPRHAQLAHPRLNDQAPPAKDEPYSKAKAIGDAAHRLMLGRGKDLAILHHDSFRTGIARDARAEAELAGKVVILKHHYDVAVEMVTAGQDQLAAAGLGDVFSLDHGDSEVCIAWQEGPYWFRSLIDWLPHNHAISWDYKTTEMSVAPWALGRLMADASWDLQAAMHDRGLSHLLDTKGERRFRFVAQEQEVPFALTVCELSQSWMEMGRRKLDYAAGHWAEGMTTGKWPLYAPQVVCPEYPNWAETAWLNREIHEAALARRGDDRDARNLMAG